MSDSQTPSLRTGLLVSAVASLLLLLLGEGILRFSGLAPSVELIQIGRFRLAANPRIGYEPVPSLPEGGEDRSFHSYRFYAYRGFGNSLGYRDYEHSIEAGRKAASFDETRGLALYNLARSLAVTDWTDEALDTLKQSRDAGFDIRQARSDTDLQSLWKDPRFNALFY